MKGIVMARGPLFLNTPISSTVKDAVGVDLFVDKLNTAIDEGAQMIAIASPFGAGKSSVVEMLQHIRKEKRKDKNKKNDKKKEKFVEVSMWSHLNGENTGGTTELHKNFIYQMASQINPRKGTYISRRLSANYGLLRLYASKGINWLLTIIVLLLFGGQWFLANYSDLVARWIPSLRGKTDWIAAAMMLTAIIIVIILLTTTDIIFSSNKSEGSRTIDGDEIMDIYRTELLKPRHFWNRQKSGTRYIVVIEDLDRTEAPETVLSFLKELRKYYVPEKDIATMYKNQANFIVTIKPESLLAPRATTGLSDEEKPSQIQENEQDDSAGESEQEDGKVEASEIRRESLYAKIFDYTLTLQTINIANYDAILHELLNDYRNELKALGAFESADIENEENLANLSGMRWIILEERIGIREIKERLNIAFTLFETLKSRSSDVAITFEKCAAAAYLMTAFEEDFYATDDRAFQDLVNYYLNLPQQDDEDFAEVSDIFAKYLNGTSKKYQRAVWDLVRSRHIDGSYRMYYYNYPRASVFYKDYEALVDSAIMHGEAVDGLEEAAQEVVKSHSKVIRKAYEELEQLKMPLPAFVFEIEPLYVEAVLYNFEELIKRMARFDYSSEGAEKTVARFERMLGFDKARIAYHEEHAKRFCELWEKEMSEPVLLQLRLMLCETLPHEILQYEKLFQGAHSIISRPEMDALPFCHMLKLINQSNKNFSEKEVEYVVSRYITQLDPQEREALRENTEAFLKKAVIILGVPKIVFALIEFMKVNNEIDGSLEKLVCDYIESADKKKRENLTANEDDDEEDAEEKSEDQEDESDSELAVSGDAVFEAYQQLINQVSSTGLSEETLQYVQRLKRYDGFSLETAQQLKNCGHIYEYVLTALYHDEKIAYEEQTIAQTILENAADLYKENQILFLELRADILEVDPKLINQYATLFGDGYPVITEREITAVAHESQDVDLQILNLIPPNKVTENNAKYLSDFFCRCKHTHEISVQILCFIGKMESDVAKKLFYNLDFDAIPYRRFSKDKQKKVKMFLKLVLELDDAASRIKFMTATKYLDAEWESALAEIITGDEELEKAYVKAVNGCEKVSSQTTSVITKLSKAYATAPHVTNRVFQEKKLFWYVSSKTLWESAFVMESGDRGETLWDTYVEMFGKTTSDSWKNTKALMAKNIEFLYRLMERKEYVKFSNENRLQMAKVLQDKDCVEEAFKRGDEFALSYFLRVAGFKDWDAASKFIDLISISEEMLTSNELYEHIYDKLVDGHLKARYTNRRKKQTES